MHASSEKPEATGKQEEQRLNTGPLSRLVKSPSSPLPVAASIEGSAQQSGWTDEQLLQVQRRLIELARDAILMRDPQNRVIYWNKGAEELYGWTAVQVIGKVTHTLLQTQFPESAEAVDRHLEQYGQWEGELTHRCANGKTVVVASRQVLIRDERGQWLTILEVNRDISAYKAEQRRAREDIRRGKERLEMAQRASRIGTFEWDVINNILVWTPELEALYGLPAGGFEGKYENWVQRVHPDDLAEAEESVRSALAGEADYNVEFRVIWPDGTIRWLLAKGKVVDYDETGRPTRMIGVNIDITERKEGERQLEQVNEELQELNANLEAMVAMRTADLRQANEDLRRSNQELQEFAYVASHDLQEPLRKIQAFGNLLEEEHGQALGEGKMYLDRMRQAASRMQTLISDLLTFSRVTTRALPFSAVNLDVIAHEVASDLETEIERNKATVIIEDLPIIEADPLQMRQILQNLLSNAIKFHRRGVSPVVKISAELLPADSEINAHLASSSNVEGWCRLVVSDNGIGFDEKYLDRIFTVFQRLHGRSEYEGTGIGLAVVRKIVERHGGSVTAKSVIGEGSTFLVTLPLKRTASEHEEEL